VSALLIVGHGTRDEDGAEEFRKFVRRVEARAVGRGVADAVAGGFIELSPPPLKDAVSELVAAGHRDVTAVPLILLAAGHAKGDIPAALAREKERHAGLRTKYARPLGPHPVVLELLRRRLHETLVASALAAEADAVLLVGRGTTDPDANADLYRASRLLWETTRDLGIRQVEAAFVSLAEPSVAQGLDRLRVLGAKRVVVLPFFLFPGVLPTRIDTQVHEWIGANAGVEATVANVIGDCDELADLVIERYVEADGRGAAPIGMNCDACVYRIALPGFESRVGQEQHPHDHPDDPAHAHEHGHDHGHAHAPGHGDEDARHGVHGDDRDVPGRVHEHATEYVHAHERDTEYAHGHTDDHVTDHAHDLSHSHHRHGTAPDPRLEVRSAPETRLSNPVGPPTTAMG
jgi:sirohydrochlorin cobaltochelatase